MIFKAFRNIYPPPVPHEKNAVLFRAPQIPENLETAQKIGKSPESSWGKWPSCDEIDQPDTDRILHRQ